MMTGEQLRVMKQLTTIANKLLNGLIKAEQHLDYCGYGDAWERELAKDDKLPQRLQKLIIDGKVILKQHRKWKNNL